MNGSSSSLRLLLLLMDEVDCAVFLLDGPSLSRSLSLDAALSISGLLEPCDR